jgi:hypothetical protein
VLRSSQVVRWLLVVPAGSIAAALIAFPIHWVVMSTLGGWSETPVIEIHDKDMLASVEAWAQAALGPFAFVYCGARVAPSVNRWVAPLIAAVVWAVCLAAPDIILALDESLHADRDMVRHALQLSGVVGAAVAVNRGRRIRGPRQEIVVGDVQSDSDRPKPSGAIDNESATQLSETLTRGHPIDNANTPTATNVHASSTDYATGQLLLVFGGAILLASAMCLVAATLSGLPYVYFQILRWVVFVVCSVTAVEALRTDGRRSRTRWDWITASVHAALAVQFNPLAPIHLQRDTWIVIDIVAGVLLLFHGTMVALIGWTRIRLSRRAE